MSFHKSVLLPSEKADLSKTVSAQIHFAPLSSNTARDQECLHTPEKGLSKVDLELNRLFYIPTTTHSEGTSDEPDILRVLQVL